MLQNRSREYWADHLFAGEPAARHVARGRAVQAAEHIASLIEPHYGADASAQLLELLKAYQLAYEADVAATRGGSAAATEAARRKLLLAAESIARFYAKRSPDIDADNLAHLFAIIVELQREETRELARALHADAAETRELMRSHTFALADTVALGLVWQFPEHFEPRERWSRY